MASQGDDKLRISSLRSLSSVIKACQDRISAWKKTVLDAVARCWVYELENPGGEFVFMRKQQAR